MQLPPTWTIFSTRSFAGVMNEMLPFTFLLSPCKGWEGVSIGGFGASGRIGFQCGEGAPRIHLLLHDS